jgi:hypothetical protein
MRGKLYQSAWLISLGLTRLDPCFFFFLHHIICPKCFCEKYSGDTSIDFAQILITMVVEKSWLKVF